MTHEHLLIADAGPVIMLASINRFDLLRKLATDVVVPRRVYEEVIAGAPRPGAKEMASDWIRVVDARPKTTEAFALLVDRGEAEALALAQDHPMSLLVIDDLRARRVATELGMRFTGTLGILRLARKEGLLTSLREEVENLRHAGFHIAETIAAEFLRQAGD